MAKWLDDENKIELTRLFLQPIPYTYLSPIGSFSCIDHFIIDTHDNNKIVKNVNIIITSKEFKILRDSNDDTLEVFKSIWDWELNFGDHRSISVEFKIKISKIDLQKN
jgi:hypothetical protein